MTGARILIVDDEAPIRQLTSRLLATSGYRVATAAGVAEARSLLERDRFELVVCDLRMPGETGVALVREVAAIRPDVAIVILSGCADGPLVEQAVELGVFGYLLKPVDASELRINVANALRRRELELENRQHRARLQQELVRSHDELRASQERFQRLAENVPDIIFRVELEPAPRIDYVSPAVSAVLGYAPAEFVQRPQIARELIHPDDRAALRALAETAAPSSIVVRWRAKDGSFVWVEQANVPIVDEAGAVVAIEGVARDISDRRLAEQALRESEERFRTLIANIPGALYSRAVDDHWTVAFVSDAIEELTGYAGSAFGAGGRGLASVVHEDDRARIHSEMLDAIARRRPYSLAYRIRRADGSVRWVGEKGQAIYGEDGEVVSVDGTMSDITERKRLEQERDRMEIELRLAQKLEAVGQLAAGIAHEINTPIQFVGDSVAFLDEAYRDLARLIDDYRELIEQAADSPLAVRARTAEKAADLDYLRERVPAAIARSYDGVERVASIVKAMKDFAHTSEIEKAPADVNEALRTTLVVARNEYKYVAAVETELGELPLVECNLSDLGQVFLNLVVNAAHAIEDATGGDGTTGVIRIRSFADGDDVVVSVADSGCGIPDSVRDRIFDPFFTTKEVGRGTGQGLAIARSIVDKHGGSIDCTSELGRGTTLTIRLPIGRTGDHAAQAA